MTDRATHEMVVSFIREFQAKREEWARQLLALDERVRQLDERMTATETLVKNFSGRLNGMESRLEDRAQKASVEAVRAFVTSEMKIILAKFEAQQAANKAISDWVYNSDFDREFALHNALEATL